MAITSNTVSRKLLLLFLLVAGMYFAREFLIPLALGGLLAMLFLPACRFLERHRVPPLLAALLCLLGILLAITGIGALLGWQLGKATDDLYLLKQKVLDTIGFVQLYIYETFGIPAGEQTRIVRDQQGGIRQLIERVAGSMLKLFTGFILTMVYVVLLLYYRRHIKEFLFLATPSLERSDTQYIISRATVVAQHYLTGLSKMIVCLWIMYGIGFSLVGVENAIFFAILCGLLEIVPFIGNITGTTVTLMVSAVHGEGLPVLAGIVITYGTVQFIQGWVLEPLILGPHVRINPLFTIIVLVIGEILWGIPGIVLAIPLTGIIKIICDEIDPLKPYGFLIGETVTRRTPPAIFSRLRRWFRGRTDRKDRS